MSSIIYELFPMYWFQAFNFEPALGHIANSTAPKSVANRSKSWSWSIVHHSNQCIQKTTPF